MQVRLNLGVATEYPATIVLHWHCAFIFKATLYPKLWWIVKELKEVFELEEF